MANRGKTACGEIILPEVGMDGMLKKRIVGVDSGEEEHSMVVLKGDGTAGAWQSVGNSCVEVRKVLESLRREMPRGAVLQLVVDSRRSLNAVVVRVAIELGLEVWQVNPVAVERFREVEGQPRKDDDQDAFLNARMRYMGAKGCRLLADPRPLPIGGFSTKGKCPGRDVLRQATSKPCRPSGTSYRGKHRSSQTAVQGHIQAAHLRHGL
jgi:hypothetical protein